MVKFTHGFRVTSSNNTNTNQPKPTKAKVVHKLQDPEPVIHCQPIKDVFVKESDNKNKGFM